MKTHTVSFKRVWIVEMLDDTTGKWVPTVGCSLTKDVGLREATKWREHNPNDRFRLRCYIAKP